MTQLALENGSSQPRDTILPNFLDSQDRIDIIDGREPSGDPADDMLFIEDDNEGEETDQ